MFYYLLLCIIPSFLYSMEEQHTYHITVTEEHVSRHNSHEADQMTEKAFLYFLGKNYPKFSKQLGKKFRQKIKEGTVEDHELWNTVEQLQIPEILTESDEANERLKLSLLKQYIVDSIEEALEESIQEKNLLTKQASSDLEKKNNELKLERYKFYAALVGVGSTLIVSLVTIITMTTI